MWLFEGVEIPNFGLNAVSGRPQEEYGIEPTRFDEIRRGCWDVDARIDDMNAGGVLASLCFPSFPQFCGQIFANTEDKDLALAVLQAYNDWHIEEWAGAHPGRFIPLSLVPYWDPELMAAEVRRMAAQGRAGGHLVREPREARRAQLPQRALGPVLAGLRRARHGRVPAHRLVLGGEAALGRGAVHHDDEPAAHRGDGHRGRPAVVPGDPGVPEHPLRALRGLDRVDPVPARTCRLRLRAPQPLDRVGLRRPAAVGGVPRPLPRLLHRGRRRACGCST